MPKKAYEWEIGQPPPILNVHSIAKHDVLRQYLSRYLNIVAANPKIDRLRLTLVDGFSGGGLYLHESTKQEISGSPLIFLEATRTAAEEINARKTKRFTLDAHYFFIEKNQLSLKFLHKTLLERGYGSLLQEDRIKLLKGEFSSKADEIISFIQKKGRTRRTIFLLDQYGYSDVPFPLLRRIFTELPYAEVILTFAVDAFGDFLANSSKSKTILSKMGLDDHFDLEQIAKAKGASDRRFFIQQMLGPIFQQQSGSLFYTPFFITSRESNRDYWLVHLSMHTRARDEMVKLHWEFKNHFRHNGGPGLNMLGYDPLKDEQHTKQPVFAEHPDFCFDEDAKTRSLHSLRQDLPEFIIRRPNGIEFQTLLAETCNTTPASSELYRETLGELLTEKEITVTSKEGGQRRKGDSIQGDDIVRASNQVSLFFLKK